MSKGETPPVTERLEMPVATQKTDSGLTPGLLRVLNKQVSFLSLEMLFIETFFTQFCIKYALCSHTNYTRINAK